MHTFPLDSLAAHGEDVWVSALVSITRPHLVRLGDHVAIDPYLHCTTALETGNHVHISSHVSIIGGAQGKLRMGHCTNISTGGRIICGTDEFKGAGLVAAPGIPDALRDTLVIEDVVFDDFANTGAQVTILPGVHLPEGVVIGANSLVKSTDALEPWTIYAGTSLRKIRLRPRERMLEAARQLGIR